MGLVSFRETFRNRNSLQIFFWFISHIPRTLQIYIIGRAFFHTEVSEIYSIIAAEAPERGTKTGCESWSSHGVFAFLQIYS